MAAERPIIIGHRRDPHVIAVSDALVMRHHKPSIVDLESISNEGGGTGLVIGDYDWAIDVDGQSLDLRLPRAGWVRRFHRADWGVGIRSGSVEALELGTWYSAYSWLLGAANINWLTKPQKLRDAESKLAQWQASRELDIPYPRTLVTTSQNAVLSAFHGEVIVKPLGTGQYIADGEVKTVYAESMMPDDERLRALMFAPFIVQERLHAIRHLRVVTVGERVWVAALEVDAAAPADWRQTSINHSSFNEIHDESPVVREGALAITRNLELGYSSQDWIENSDGETHLIDVNPAGQWLFLPAAIGAAITGAIADRLLGTS